MNDQVDLFGDNSSKSKSNNQGGFGSNPNSQGGFQGGGFNSNFNQGGGLPFKNPQQEPPKKSHKKLWIALGVIATLGIIGTGSTLAYKHSQ